MRRGGSPAGTNAYAAKSQSDGRFVPRTIGTQLIVFELRPLLISRCSATIRIPLRVASLGNVTVLS